jgi:hypothetical protein
VFGLPDGRRLRRARLALAAVPRRRWRRQRLLARSGLTLRHEDLFVTTAAGYRVAVHVHEPDDTQPRPAMLLIPGWGKDGSVFCGDLYVVAAEDLAARGIRAVHWDPIGRGDSWGHDDFCGVESQDGLRAVMDWLHARRDVAADRVAVLSCSMGLSLAVPVLAGEGARWGTRCLIDWEGPADRGAIAGHSVLPPAARSAVARDAEHFWSHREPITSIHRLPCGYIRVQAREDHALGASGVDCALALVAAATRGRAPWTQLNDNPRDTAWRSDQKEVLRWAPSESAALSDWLLTLSTRLLTEVL